MKTNNLLLVPTDFTKVAENAASHAASLAKIIAGEICLFHVIDKEKDRAKAEETITAAASKIESETGIKCGWRVEEGSIFEDIGKVADEMGARLIFMGTHGAKGTQKLLGSYALKVVINSQVPFVIVHEKPVGHGYKKILVPIDLSKENKQITTAIKDIAQYFQSEILLLVREEKDEFFARQVTNNLNFAKRFLEENSIKYSVQTAGGKSFAKEVIHAAAANNVDLVAIVNLKEHSMELLGGSFEQDIIANDTQIPVIVLNQLDTLKTGSFTGFFR